jgi:hypothetical protein
MAKIVRTGNLVEIGDSHRIEPGPRKLTNVATSSLLRNDVTAAHYALQIEDGQGGKRPGIDAHGEVIEIDKPMTYLDWVGHQNGGDGSTVFYLYEHGPMTKAQLKERGLDEGSIWHEIGAFTSEEDALGAALEKMGG